MEKQTQDKPMKIEMPPRNAAIHNSLLFAGPVKHDSHFQRLAKKGAFSGLMYPLSPKRETPSKQHDATIVVRQAER